MKICLINNLYKPLARGGAEIVVELMADGLLKAGHEIFIITTKSLLKEIKAGNGLPGIKIFYLNALYYNLNKLPKILRIFWHMIDMFDLGSLIKVRSILKKEKPDLVMTHNLKGVGYLIPAGIKNLKIKWAHYLHDIQLIYPSGLMIYGQEKKTESVFAKIYSNICRWLFSSPDIVISPSSWLMQFHTRKGFFKNSRREVLANPWLSPEFKLMPDIKKENEIFRFIYIGQIEEHKGAIFLIDSFKRFLSRFSGCELTIAGHGLKLSQAKNLTAGIKNIKIVETKDKKEIGKLMQESDCLIVPSLCYENSPMVIYWAASLGLPVIASRSGGIVELIGILGGLLFEPNSKDDLISKLNWARQNKVELERIGEESKKRVKQFSLENFLKKLIKVLEL